MHRLRLSLALALFVAPATLAVPHVAEASVVEALTLRQLVRESDHVVVARVESQRAHYDELGRIVTDVTIRVEEAMHGGAARSATLVVRRLGGVVGDVGLRVEGEASFVDGERLVLFARVLRVPGGTVLRPVGMSQGVLPIDASSGVEMIQPGGAGLELVVPRGDGSLQPSPPAFTTAQPADQALDAIRELCQEVHGGR